MSHDDLWALGPFIIQSLFILIAPALFAASIYIILGRIILLVDGERYSLVRQKWLTKIFVTGDVISFMLQGAGKYSSPYYNSSITNNGSRRRHPSWRHLDSSPHRRETHHRRALHATLLLRLLHRHRRHVPLPPNQRQARAEASRPPKTPFHTVYAIRQPH